MEKGRYPRLEGLVGEMSHHIKNLLNKLEGGAYMVNSGLKRDRPEIVKSGWSIVEDNINRVSDLLMNIILYSREAPEPESCSPNDILEEVYDTIKARIKDSGTRLSKKLAPDVDTCHIDPKAIHMALLNVCVYLLDSEDDKDKGERKTGLDLAVEKGKGGAKFTISVSGGRQLAAEYPLTLEDLYKGESKGRGFGLCVAQKIVQGHGGTLTLESTPDKGTVFALYVPANPGSSG
ncbi:MAG: HAMP domain-containing histidine kinase [Deltaproteobacteria bacterium]|nr:HAMP domain-containing histidine kinase [Deltaproteobacteria bacterium]MBW2137052.1 HAMP domain-containing histidine kinase [Deltaproteobacteria bacterium]